MRTPKPSVKIQTEQRRSASQQCFSMDFPLALRCLPASVLLFTALSTNCCCSGWSSPLVDPTTTNGRGRIRGWIPSATTTPFIVKSNWQDVCEKSIHPA